MHLQDQTTVQESQPAFDDAHLNNLIAALHIELRERAIAMKDQMPDATMAQLRVSVTVDTDEQTSRPMFTASARLQSGEFLCKARFGAWQESRDAMLHEAQVTRGFNAFKRDIGYVPKPQSDDDAPAIAEFDALPAGEESERDRRERLEINHQVAERFDGLS